MTTHYPTSFLFLLLTFLGFNGFSFGLDVQINKEAYYAAFSSNDTLAMNQQINVLERKNNADWEPFVGALKMKKSGFLKAQGDKIRLFNEGKTQLEQGISRQPKNVALRFLRFAIQENCPPLLKYNQQLDEDAAWINKNYFNADSITQNAIKQYSLSAKTQKGKELGSVLK